LVDHYQDRLRVAVASNSRRLMKKHAPVCLLVFLTLTGLSGAGLNVLTRAEKSHGWVLLFDGKTLNGWHSSVPAPPQGRGRGQAGGGPQGRGAPQPGAAPQVGSSPGPCVSERGGTQPAGASHWEVVDGLLTACGDPAGYLTSDESYKNFVLSIEFKCGEDTNSGVFIRSPQENGGYEVQIWKDQPAGYNTGGIVGTAKTAREFKFKANEWNVYSITADGEHLIVSLNGETTLDIHDAKFAYGNLRLQYQKFPIAFRNIKIRPLP
jgi:hypothetical protein